MEHSIIDFMLNDGGVHEKIKCSDKYEKYRQEETKLYNEFTKTLNEEQQEQFEKFIEILMDEECEASETYFKMGVKIGVRLASECMFDF